MTAEPSTAVIATASRHYVVSCRVFQSGAGVGVGVVHRIGGSTDIEL